VSDADLLADPAVKIASVGGSAHPSIPLPKDIFPGRVNSGGLDLADAGVLAATTERVAVPPLTPPVPGGGSAGSRGSPSAAREYVPQAGPPPGTGGARGETSASTAVSTAHAAFPAWTATPVDARAAILDRLADLLERDRLALMALCVDEARKTIPDALAEVREAVDFCRYYAIRARADFAPVLLPGPTGERNELRLAGRGVFACVAPWNFPLAIFIGQVAAALVTGNTVVAKPAPQTPRIAAAAVALAYEAGVPEGALQLVTGGADAGRSLVADVRVQGVAFTGSTATARAIARTLLEDDSRPLVPLIAETGGINAMIVDSTALPEQVVADVVTSAFRSAGQRCSALRLLLLQEDIADKTLHMLSGAMDTLVLGEAGDPRTDVGPVIDAAAYERLETYRQSQKARWVHALTTDDARIVPPSIIRIDRIADLKQEWFGPMLHVATWKAGELDATLAAINATGFGLTMGLHSRIASTADKVAALAQVGNLYVNRSMIGAVVGSQPFGGEGLSGTGFKAGGPHYLLRFATERTVSTDTTSAGGNASLLSIEDVGGI